MKRSLFVFLLVITILNFHNIFCSQEQLPSRSEMSKMQQELESLRLRVDGFMHAVMKHKEQFDEMLNSQGRLIALVTRHQDQQDHLVELVKTHKEHISVLMTLGLQHAEQLQALKTQQAVQERQINNMAQLCVRVSEIEKQLARAKKN
jgi:hypothetical protein